MTTTTVDHKVTKGGGQPVPNAQVLVDLYPDGPGYVDADDLTVEAYIRTKTDSNGDVSFDLIPNDEITPSGTAWRVRDWPQPGKIRTHYIIVPIGGGPLWLGDLLTDPPASIASPALSVHLADTAPHVPAGFALDADLDAHITNGTHSETLTLDLQTATILGADTDNWADAVFDLGSIIRMSSSLDIELRGIDASAYPGNGRLVWLHNVGSFDVTLKNQAVTSSAANRFNLDGDDFLLASQSSVLLTREGGPGPAARRWSVLTDRTTRVPVTGSRADPEQALAELLSVLTTLNIIDDQSTV